jgi:TonB family protein
VYKNGKVIFQLPSQPSGQAANGLPAVPVGSAVKKNDLLNPTPVRISPQIAAGYLIARVEPEYPKPAREGHIQGPVVLDVVVGKDGVVQTVKMISGSSELVAAASDAVRQWRFRPFFRNGQPEGFQTQITVVFRLP